MDGGTLTINDSTMSSNRQKTAMVAQSTTITEQSRFSNSDLKDNRASVNDYEWGDGGAIYNNYGTVTISNSNLNSNEAGSVSYSRGDGGAIYNHYGTSRSATAI